MHVHYIVQLKLIIIIRITVRITVIVKEIINISMNIMNHANQVTDLETVFVCVTLRYVILYLVRYYRLTII